MPGLLILLLLLLCSAPLAAALRLHCFQCHGLNFQPWMQGPVQPLFRSPPQPQLIPMLPGGMQAARPKPGRTAKAQAEPKRGTVYAGRSFAGSKSLVPKIAEKLKEISVKRYSRTLKSGETVEFSESTLLSKPGQLSMVAYIYQGLLITERKEGKVRVIPVIVKFNKKNSDTSAETQSGGYLHHSDLQQEMNTLEKLKGWEPAPYFFGTITPPADLEILVDSPGMVMEFINGTTLSNYLKHVSESPKKCAKLLCIFRKLLATVVGMFGDKGILHMDFHFANIMVERLNNESECAEIRIIDFGRVTHRANIEKWRGDVPKFIGTLFGRLQRELDHFGSGTCKIADQQRWGEMTVNIAAVATKVPKSLINQTIKNIRSTHSNPGVFLNSLKELQKDNITL